MPAPPPIVLGTAGHIDHGKTALVRALTGIDTDRLKEEKERGITIELGFAWLDLGAYRFGVVDVPGHERFVKTMVAGATGIDLVVLVVAADEGVMPQTREHLDICRLLRIPRGLVALTKADLVTPDWLELVREDVRQVVAGTFLEGAPVVPCSAVTGAGLAALKAALQELAPQVPGRDEGGLARLPIDRVFTMHGFGTVVTGTLAAGRLREGDDVVALPGGAAGKVRGLQVHGAPTPEARAGHRTAVNLGGVPRQDLERGEVLTHAGALTPTAVLDAEVELLAACRGPLARRTRLIFHAGTAQTQCTALLVEGDALAPGAGGLVQLHLARPAVVLPGDRFILRGFTPQEHYGTTVGGGRVLRILGPKLRGRDPEFAARLRRMAAAGVDERVALEVEAAGARGRERGDLVRRLGVAPRVVEAALARLLASRTLVRFDAEREAVVHASALEELRRRALAAVDHFHAEHPVQAGMSREEVRSKLPAYASPRLFHLVAEGLVREGALAADRDLLKRPGHEARAEAAGGDLRERVAALYRAQALTPPRHQEVLPALAAAGGAPREPEVRAVIEALARDGLLVRVRPDLYFDRDALAALRERLRAFLVERNEITAQEFKELTGASRKFSIPLAEHFDAEKLTLRVGEVRRLRR
ncbi:MAG TPA: selenocysteine-specific translation elongation factor [Polyangia bacterium]|jgi:selenocysteine-specific elongation factor